MEEGTSEGWLLGIAEGTSEGRLLGSEEVLGTSEGEEEGRLLGSDEGAFDDLDFGSLLETFAFGSLEFLPMTVVAWFALIF